MTNFDTIHQLFSYADAVTCVMTDGRTERLYNGWSTCEYNKEL